MTRRADASPEILGRLLLLHSALPVALDEARSAEMLTAALGAVPGVREVFIRLDQAPASGAAPVHAGSWSCAIRTLRSDFGEFRLEIDDQVAFAVYAPFIANLANQFASQIEGRRFAARIERLNRSLDAALADRSRTFRTLFENMAEGVTILDASQRVVEANPAALTLLGVEAASLLGSIPSSSKLPLVDECGRPLSDAEFPSRRAIDAGHAIEGAVIGVLRAQPGKAIWLSVNAIPLFDSVSGALANVFVSFRDISERRAAEESLRIAAIAFESQDGIIVTDADGVIQRVNRAFTRMTGYAEDDVIGKTPAMLKSGRQNANFYIQMWATIARDGYWQGELVSRDKFGGLFTERLSISAVKAPSGTVTHYVGSMSDLTLQREAESKAEHLAYFDALTDLPNRVLLYDRLARSLAWSARSDEYCALLFIDLDHFKEVNDSIGHHGGDQLLVRAAQRLRQFVREGDTIARFGGDEFVVVLEDLGADAHAAGLHAGAVAEKLRLGMSQAYDLDGLAYYCTASVGLTLFKGGSATAETILMHADLAMDRAKRDGRNALRYFEESMQVELTARTLLDRDLRVAIEARQFVLYYQPQFDRQGLAVGAEALVRWNHPRRGLLAPGEFIGLAEETGLIVPLGQWVLNEACARIAAWGKQEATRNLVMAVNVSARQFAELDFVPSVLRALAGAAADPSRLELELTESTVLDNVDDALAKMRALKHAGINFSLDDFGTGSSSLSYLTRLPLDQLKIDKSFVDDLPQNRQDALVAQTIIAMGKGLGLSVVAEGVETEAQLEFLLQHGCDVFQGFHFARPLHIDAFNALISGAESAAAGEPG